MDLSGSALGERLRGRVHVELGSLRDRGPDFQDVLEGRNHEIGQTRLAIVGGESVAHQPFKTADGKWVFTFNGEFFNLRELQQKFPVADDSSEVHWLANAYQKYGALIFSHIRGMFAIAAINLEIPELLLARDRWGTKPLYFHTQGSTVIWSSKLACLARFSASPTISKSFMECFLQLGFVPQSHSNSHFATEVPPGTVKRFKNGAEESFAIGESFSHSAEPRSMREAFLASLDEHSTSDVPIAVQLSGGFDSAALAEGMQTLGQQVHGVHLTFDAQLPKGLGPSERDSARRNAANFCSSYTEAVVAPGIEDLNQFLQEVDRPSVDGLNQWLVCGAIKREGFKVAWSGTGLDEFIGSYAHVRLWERNSWIIKSQLNKTINPDFFPKRFMSPRLREKWRAAGRLPQTSLEAFTFARSLEVSSWVGLADSLSHGHKGSAALRDIEIETYLRFQLLADADQFGMANSVEVRVPFVTSGLGNLIKHVYKYKSKAELAEALGSPRLLQIALETKRGFELPMNSWLQNVRLSQADVSNFALWELLEVRPPNVPLSSDYRPCFNDHWTWKNLWSIFVAEAWVRRITGSEPLELVGNNEPA